MKPTQNNNRVNIIWTRLNMHGEQTARVSDMMTANETRINIIRDLRLTA